MKNSRKLTVAAAGITALALSACGSAEAGDEEFPTDDITMVISYSAGGPTDASGRAIAGALEQSLGVSVVVENVTGASGTVGTAQVVNAKPDGYTIGMTTASAVSRVPVFQDVGYTLEDIQPLAMGIEGAGVILVPADSPHETAEDFFQAAEENPDSITVATGGAQTPQQFELERLRQDHGISFRTVPHEGDAPVLNALVGGNADAAFPSNSDLTMSYVESGELRPLVFSEAERADYLPDTPTFTELGYEGLTYGGSDFIVVAPQDIPQNTLDVYNAELEKALTDPAVVETIGEIRVPEEFVGPEALSEHLQDEQDTLRPVLEDVFN